MVNKKVKKGAMVTVVAIEEKKSKLVPGKEYEVTKEIAGILIKAKRAKAK